LAVSEESKHRLYGRLEEVLGHDEAMTFMEMVRPQGWDDIATKADLTRLETATRTDLQSLETATRTGLELLEARLEGRIASTINQATTSQTRALILSNVVANASMLAGVAAILAVLR